MNQDVLATAGYCIARKGISYAHRRQAHTHLHFVDHLHGSRLVSSASVLRHSAVLCCAAASSSTAESPATCMQSPIMSGQNTVRQCMAGRLLQRAVVLAVQTSCKVRVVRIKLHLPRTKSSLNC